MAKRGTLEHPKNRRLARALGTIPGVTLGLIESLWHYTAQWHSHGRLTRLDLEEALDRSGGWLAMFKVEQLIEAMTHPDYRWLDPLEDGSYYVHDWHEHCEDAVHAKLYRRLELFGNGSRPQPKKVDHKTRKELDKAWAAKYGTSAAVPIKTAAGSPKTAAKEDAAENGSQRRPAIALALALALAKPEPKPMPLPVCDDGDDLRPIDHSETLKPFDQGLHQPILNLAIHYQVRRYGSPNPHASWYRSLLTEIGTVLEVQHDAHGATLTLLEVCRSKPSPGLPRDASFMKIAEAAGLRASRNAGRNEKPAHPSGPTTCNALEREKQKIAEAKANPAPPGYLAELRKKAQARRPA
jgi:hypothetical protein